MAYAAFYHILGTAGLGTVTLKRSLRLRSPDIPITIPAAGTIGGPLLTPLTVRYGYNLSAIGQMGGTIKLAEIIGPQQGIRRSHDTRGERPRRYR
jgi:hypothetical protein